MQPLRRGDTGPVVAEVRAMLARIGLLNNTEARAAHLFDEDTELAVRHFQQRRGVSVDGMVGRETFTALTGAHWTLGDRVLAHEATGLLTGDANTAVRLNGSTGQVTVPSTAALNPTNPPSGQSPHWSTPPPRPPDQPHQPEHRRTR